jgi:predicted NUDIX family NTP pyrophosphohydrolase
VKRSAGLVLYRHHSVLEVLLVHPGGPFFANTDVWGIPKGEYDATEDPLAAAEREFTEETGFTAPDGPRRDLGEVTLKSGKRVVAWAVEGDLDADACVSNTFRMPWRGRMQEFPEVDAAAWFDLPAAQARMAERQLPFLERLATLLG